MYSLSFLFSPFAFLSLKSPLFEQRTLSQTQQEAGRSIITKGSNDKTKKTSQSANYNLCLCDERASELLQVLVLELINRLKSFTSREKTKKSLANICFNLLRRQNVDNAVHLQISSCLHLNHLTSLSHSMPQPRSWQTDTTCEIHVIIKINEEP